MQPQTETTTTTTTTKKLHADDKDDNDDNAEKAIKYTTASLVSQECGRVVRGVVGQEGVRAMPRLPYFDRESGAHGWPSPPRSPLCQPVGSGMDPDVRENPHARAVGRLKQVANQSDTTTTNKAHADDKYDNDDNAEKAIK